MRAPIKSMHYTLAIILFFGLFGEISSASPAPLTAGTTNSSASTLSKACEKAVTIDHTKYILNTGCQKCMTSEELKPLAGNWARKSVWNAIKKNKNWSTVEQPDIDAVIINTDGNNNAIYGWHEASPQCVQKHDDRLWIIDTILSSDRIGPFISIGTDPDIRDPYFQRIFENKCFTSDKKEKWCFSTSSISINNKKHPAWILLDKSEVPNYGTAIRFNKEDTDKLLVFVPQDKGWKVYEDTWESSHNYIPIDLKTATPWRVLTPD
jgi:hypothetical protein